MATPASNSPHSPSPGVATPGRPLTRVLIRVVRDSSATLSRPGALRPWPIRAVTRTQHADWPSRAEQVSCLVQVIFTENKQKSTSSYSSNIMAAFQNKEPLQKGRGQQGCSHSGRLHGAWPSRAILLAGRTVTPAATPRRRGSEAARGGPRAAAAGAPGPQSRSSGWPGWGRDLSFDDVRSASVLDLYPGPAQAKAPSPLPSDGNPGSAPEWHPETMRSQDEERAPFEPGRLGS